MSASEKLKALDAIRSDGGYSEARRAGSNVLDALPQIVAVVEAASEARAAFSYIAQTQRLHPSQNLEKYARVNEGLIADALAALDEALT
jgi:hypothetical protein